MELYFYLILGIAAVLGTAFAVSTKEIYYTTPDTDNELMAYAAAQSHKWHWPSDVHKHKIGKTFMKDVTIFLLSVFQKIFRDKNTDHPYTAMTGFSISLSTVLIYLILSHYFGAPVAFFIALLYAVSFWPWHVSLYGGHANISNLFFLFSILALQRSVNTGVYFAVLSLSGAFLCLSLFGSPSSNKLLIPFWAAASVAGYESTGTFVIRSEWLNFLSAAMLFGFVLGYFTVKLNLPRIVTLMYEKRGPKFMQNIIQGRDKFPIEHYVNVARRKFNKIFRIGVIIIAAILSVFYLVGILPTIYIFLGWLLTFLALTLPNVKENVMNYFKYMYLPQRKTHFKDYIAYFAKRGITVRQNTRGAGLSWVPKLLWTFAPFHMALFIALFAVGQYKSLIAGNMAESASLLIVTVISLSPIIWAEITRAPQFSRSYSPGLITGLLLPAYVLSDMIWSVNTLIFLCGFVILTFAWNFWKLADDIYPSRMIVKNFMQVVRQLGINDIYTYQTSLNSFFVDTIPGIGKSEYLPKQEVVPPFNVHRIKRLDEVTDGWIAIPGINPIDTAVTDENIKDDLVNDPVYNHIIRSKLMDKIATAKFKTYVTSTIWLNEDEVASYCFLHLKDIGPDEHYRGYAWLVHSSKLNF